MSNANRADLLKPPSRTGVAALHALELVDVEVGKQNASAQLLVAEGRKQIGHEVLDVGRSAGVVTSQPYSILAFRVHERTLDADHSVEVGRGRRRLYR